MLTGIVAVIIGLGVMILVHEWGHFIVARAFSVRVDVFSIGFGPRVAGRKSGATDYRLSLLPLGGYVRMAGDNPAEERTGAPDEFLSKPRWQRALIILAGPTTNFLLAIVLTAAVFIHGTRQPSYIDDPVVIAGVIKDSPAQQAGIQPGDRIVSFAGSKDPTWDRVDLEVGLSAPGQSQPVIVERDGRLMSLTTRIPSGDPFAAVGYPPEPTIVGKVTPDRPAAKAGLMPGDTIITVDGRRLSSPNQLPGMIQEIGGRPTQLEILRDGKTAMVEVTPFWGDPGDGRPRWGIGIGFGSSTIIKTYPVPEAIWKAGQFSFILGAKVIYTVGDLITRKVSPKLLMGPLGIVQVSGEAAQVGYDALIRLMAMISLNLAVFNLLPIPILDGGHIFMLAAEGLLRRDLSLKLKERVLTAGMVLLLALFLFVMFNDVARLFPNL